MDSGGVLGCSDRPSWEMIFRGKRGFIAGVPRKNALIPRKSVKTDRTGTVGSKKKNFTEERCPTLAHFLLKSTEIEKEGKRKRSRRHEMWVFQSQNKKYVDQRGGFGKGLPVMKTSLIHIPPTKSGQKVRNYRRQKKHNNRKAERNKGKFRYSRMFTNETAVR